MTAGRNRESRYDRRIMKVVQVSNNLIVLDNVTRVTYEVNDVKITADNRCSIYFPNRLIS